MAASSGPAKLDAPAAGGLVSIGMPVFNGEKWLAATIESIVQQDYADIELVIADNASTDETQAICRTYADRDPRIRYFRNDINIGVSNNFNRVFELSRGPYFKWTSCSDLIAPQFVRRCAEVLSSRPEVALVYPITRLFMTDPGNGRDYNDGLRLDVDGRADRFICYSRGAELNNVMHGIFRRAVLGRTQLYRKFIGADYNLIADLLLRGPAVRVPQVLHFRRIESETFTAMLSLEQVKWLYDPDRPGSMLFQLWRREMNYWGIIMRAPLPIGERLRIGGYLVRRMVELREKLAQDAWESLTHMFASRGAEGRG